MQVLSCLTVAALLMVTVAVMTGCGQDSGLPPRPSPSVLPPVVAPAPAPVPSDGSTRTIRGTVQDLDGVRLESIRVTSPFGAMTLTDSAGGFALSYPANTTSNFITAAGNDVEERIAGFTRGSVDVQLAPLRLQRRLMLNVGDRMSSMIAPTDLGNWLGEPYEDDYCQPCKKIRVRLPSQGVVTLNLEWSGEMILHLWLRALEVGLPRGSGPNRISERISLPAGEHVFYVGLPEVNPAPLLHGPISFTLSAFVE